MRWTKLPDVAGIISTAGKDATYNKLFVSTKHPVGKHEKLTGLGFLVPTVTQWPTKLYPGGGIGSHITNLDVPSDISINFLKFGKNILR